MRARSQQLTAQFERRLLSVLLPLLHLQHRDDLTDTAAKKLARAVEKLSNFYIHDPGRPTPWKDPETQAAYLSYFLPLNYARLKQAFVEVKRFLPPPMITEIWDFGSGPGTTQWVLEELDFLSPRKFVCVESAMEARVVHNRLRDADRCRWQPEFSERISPGAEALGIFSYSHLEMGGTQLTSAFDHLLVLEPSTRNAGRSLQRLRGQWIEQGYQPLAPCTHSLPCPLLVHSERDWCHDRIGWVAPEWWLEMEKYLLMKNQTLTYSYLVMSRTVRDTKWRGQTRMVGDTLHEKGKSRQLMCRSDHREFMAWLHKLGEPPIIPHGSLVAGLDDAEIKGNEVRPKGILQIEE